MNIDRDDSLCGWEIGSGLSVSNDACYAAEFTDFRGRLGYPVVRLQLCSL